MHIHNIKKIITTYHNSFKCKRHSAPIYYITAYNIIEYACIKMYLQLIHHNLKPICYLQSSVRIINPCLINKSLTCS